MSHRRKQKDAKKAERFGPRGILCPVCGEPGVQHLLLASEEVEAFAAESDMDVKSEPTTDELCQQILVDHVCPTCGTALEPLPDGLAGGLCPKCLSLHILTVDTGRPVR